MPDLFCATAQIFFPDNARREETGKAVMPFPSDRKPTDFPVLLVASCPSPREDLSYVLYGSGGCSLFDARKLLQLGGLDEIYEPAYVGGSRSGDSAAGNKAGHPVFVAGARVLHKHRATTVPLLHPRISRSNSRIKLPAVSSTRHRQPESIPPPMARSNRQAECLERPNNTA